MATIRCVFMGESSVGKSTILYLMSKKTYRVVPTIGVDNILFGYKRIQFQCWDTSGSPQFGSVVDLFEQKTLNKVYVYDTSRPTTFRPDKAQDGMIIANIRDNHPPLNETHVAVDICRPETIEGLLDLMTTTFRIEEPTFSNGQRECCTCF